MFVLLAACDASLTLGDPPVDPAADDTGASGDAGPLYDPDVLHEVEITLDPGDWDTLRYQERTYYDILGDGCMEGPFDSPYTWFEAEVTVDGEALGVVGVRKKGLIGSNNYERPSLRLDLDHYQDGARYLGLEKVVLNNNNQDASRMRTCLAHDFFADAGLVAPRCSLARVVVNGEDLGVYDNTEVIDELLVERVRGAAPTTLYEGTLSDFREGWLATFEPETDESTGAELQAVTDALAAEDDVLLDALDRVLDLDAYFTFWAAESFAGHWDGYNGNTNNFYVFSDPEDGRLEFIASGPDAAFDSTTPFGWGAPVWVATASALSNRLIRHPEGKARFEAELTRLVDEVWDESSRLDRIDEWKDLARDALTLEERRAVGDLRDIVASREGDVRAGLGDPVTPDALREPFCWSPVGQVDVTFATTWGSYPSGDLFGGGEVSTRYEIQGTTYTSVADGASIGWAGDGTAIWITISTLSEGVYFAPYVILKPDALVSGVDIPLDGELAQALLLYNSPETGGQWQTAAWLGEGSIRFDTIALDDGEAVVGELDAAVLGSE
jgi:hypothetical protein